MACRGVDLDVSSGIIGLHDNRRGLLTLLTRHVGWLCASLACFMIAVAGIWVVAAGLAVNVETSRGSTLSNYGQLGIFAVIGAVVATAAAMRVMPRLFDSKVDLILSRDGICDRWLIRDVIPWSDIAFVRFVRGYSHFTESRPGERRRIISEPDYVEIEYKDDRAYLRRLPLFGRWRVARHRAKTFRRTAVPLSGDGGRNLALSAADVVWLIGRYCDTRGLPDGYQPEHPELKLYRSATLEQLDDEETEPVGA